MPIPPKRPGATPPPSTEPSLSEQIGNLLDKLAFQPQNILDAAADNPVLFKLAVDFRWSSMRKRNAAKLEFERISAERELKVRKEARANGEKITNDEVAALLITDPSVLIVRKKYDECDEMDEYSKLVVEAFRMRRDSLKVVSDLVKDEVSLQRAVEQNADKILETRRKLRERYPGGSV